jgi:predicted ATP-binding protein involved in virulence
MKITKITLQNFRGIGSLELEFPIEQNIIALVGVNGVGKSSILDAITALLSTALFLINYGDTKNLVSGRSGLQLKFFKDSDIKISKQMMSCEIVFSSSSIHSTLSVSRSPNLLDKIDKCDIPDKIPKDLLVSYSSNRHSTLISSIFGLPKTSIPNILNDDSITKFEEFFTWFKALEDIENEERLERNSEYRDKSLEAIRMAVSSILGDGFVRLRVKRATNNLIVNKEGVDISIDLLSDGEKSLITIVSDIAKKLSTSYPDLERPLEGSGVILIDEIELHMHPTWQRMIVPRLTKTFPNCQFIITTHSPQVLSHVQPESIYLLKKVGEDIVVTKPQYSYGRDSNRILEDLMEETERPAEIQDQLGELFSLIHQGHLSESQQLVKQLSETIGASEPELAKAEVMIKRREIIGR